MSATAPPSARTPSPSSPTCLTSARSRSARTRRCASPSCAASAMSSAFHPLKRCATRSCATSPAPAATLSSAAESPDRSAVCYRPARNFLVRRTRTTPYNLREEQLPMGLGFLTFLFYPWGLILQGLAILHFIRRRPDTWWLWVILLLGDHLAIWHPVRVVLQREFEV